MANFGDTAVTVDIAFGDDPLEASPTWTDVTSTVRALSFGRGRQHELNRFEAGTATFTLDNRDGAFNPDNTASTHYPDVKPMVPIRVQAVENAITYDMWSGFVERWPMSNPGKVDAVVKVVAVDLFKLLSRQGLSSRWEATVLEMGPRAFWRFSGSATKDLAEDHELDWSTGPTATDQTGAWTLDKAVNLVAADGATADDGTRNLDIHGDFSIAVWLNADDTSDQRVVVSRAGVSDTPYHFRLNPDDSLVFIQQSSAGTEQFFGSPIATTTWVFVVVTRAIAGNIIFYIDGVQDGIPQSHLARSGSESTATLLPVSWRGDLSEVALFDRVLTPLEVSTLHAENVEQFQSERTDQRIQTILDDVGVSGSDLQTGRSTMAARSGAGTALTEIELAADTESGQFFIAGDGAPTFHDRHFRAVTNGTPIDTFDSDLPFTDIGGSLDDDLIFNEVRVSPVAGVSTATDATSQSTFGIRTLSLKISPLDDGDAVDHAEWLLSRHKDPEFRVEQLDIVLRDTPTALWPIILGAELGDRYTVTQVRAGDDLSTDVYLERMRHTLLPGQQWAVTWQLSPAEAESMWILEDAVLGLLGTTTVVGF